MDGLIKKKERVFVLAASNLPWDLDIALLRRLEKRVMVELNNFKNILVDFSTFTRTKGKRSYDQEIPSR